MKNPYLELAHQAIQNFLKTGKPLRTPPSLPEVMITRRAATFVSLHQKDGSLRGCIGTYLPTKPNIAEEIIANAIAAATKDPRFPPVTSKELPRLEISVDVLTPPKLIKNNYYLDQTPPKILDPKKYGLIASTNDGRRGLLLPGIPGVDSSKKQLQICYQKAGIAFQEPTALSIFSVERYGRK